VVARSREQGLHVPVCPVFLSCNCQILNYTRGHLFELRRCANLLLTNVTFRNSPFWTLHPWACSGVTVTHCGIHAPLGSPNTDGFDPDSCSDVVFAHNTVRARANGFCTTVIYSRTRRSAVVMIMSRLRYNQLPAFKHHMQCFFTLQQERHGPSWGPLQHGQ
jgi:hypothetical protein